jgi:hypothetical protein
MFPNNAIQALMRNIHFQQQVQEQQINSQHHQLLFPDSPLC